MEQGNHRTLLRFRSKLAERKKLGPVTTLDIVKLYGEELVELNSLSKFVIKDLAAAAADLKKHADGIAIAICDRILKVSTGEQKLSSLYLLDCIIKNDINSPVYPKCFEACLLEVFEDTYRKLNSNRRFYMHRLFNSWSPYFSHSVLHKIKVGLYLDQDLSSNLIHCESQCPHIHGIHDHQEYVEAHHQSKHSTVDAQPVKLPSCLQSCKQKSSFQHGEYDPDSHELLSPHPQLGRIGATMEGGVEDIKPHPTPSSSPQVEPTIDTSSKRVVQGSSLFVCGSGRAGDWNDGIARIQPSGSGVQNPEASVAYDRNNGCYKLHDRLLTEAYGNEDASHDKLAKLQRLHFDGIISEREMKDSRSFEEECGWETMSPTFPSQCKRYKQTPFEHSTGLTQPQGVYMGKGFGSDWHKQALRPQPDNPANVVDYGRSFSDKCQDALASQRESCPQYQSSYQAQELVTFSNFYPQPSQPTFYPGLQGNLLQVPCLASGTHGISPFASASVSHLVPQISSNVLAQGSVTSRIAPSPFQHPHSSSRPLYPYPICPPHPTAAAAPPYPLHHHRHPGAPFPPPPPPAVFLPVHLHSGPFPSRSVPPRPFHPNPLPPITTSLHPIPVLSPLTATQKASTSTYPPARPSLPSRPLLASSQGSTS